METRLADQLVNLMGLPNPIKPTPQFFEKMERAGITAYLNKREDLPDQIIIEGATWRLTIGLFSTSLQFQTPYGTVTMRNAGRVWSWGEKEDTILRAISSSQWDIMAERSEVFALLHLIDVLVQYRMDAVPSIPTGEDEEREKEVEETLL